MYTEESKNTAFHNTDKLLITIVVNPLNNEKSFLVTNQYEGGAYLQSFNCKEISFDGIKFKIDED